MSDKVIHNLFKPVDNSLDTPMLTPKLSTYLTSAICLQSSFRAAEAVRSGRTLKHWGALFAFAATVTIGVLPAQANQQSTDHYKLYLHSKIVNYKQFKCAYEVAHRESRWNWRAVNGSHYGLFQMRNKKVQYMNPYTQIDWWLRYVSHRYKGTPCLSLAHLKSKGWQ